MKYTALGESLMTNIALGFCDILVMKTITTLHSIQKSTTLQYNRTIQGNYIRLHNPYNYKSDYLVTSL